MPELTTDEANGCCYCLVERSGERSFLCEHGAEYHFRPEWFAQLNPKEFGAVYVCGLELEEESGHCILEFLEQNPQLQVFFAPGSRTAKIEVRRVERLLALHPVLHLNETEALQLTDALFGRGEVPHVEGAARKLGELTENSVIVTLGKRGAMCCEDGRVTYLAGKAAEAVDTTGAGDAHIGAVIACHTLGLPLIGAAAKANEVAAACVSVYGSELTEASFPKIDLSDFDVKGQTNGAGYIAG